MSTSDADGDALVLNGLALLGLLARAVERVPCERPVQVTRCACDLMRAAPMASARTSARVLRRGSSVEVIEAELFAGEANSPLVRCAFVSDFPHSVPFVRAMKRDREARPESWRRHAK